MSFDDEVVVLSSDESDSSFKVSPKHINSATALQIQQLSCPFCSFNCEEIEILENHVENQHIQESSTPPTLNKECCPVCFLSQFQSAEELEKHVNGHFEVANLEISDETLAQKVEEENRSLRREQEHKEFKQLQSIYGFNEAKTLNRQRETYLFRSAERGHLSAAEYHEKRILSKVFEKNGLDDGTSKSVDIISHLRKLSCHSSGDYLWLSSAVDHYAISFGDSGWGCGYRNLQMILSSLLRHPEYFEKLESMLPSTKFDQSSPAPMPSISRLQLAIEEAWKSGFDLQGCEQLGGKLSGTCKWIGATEIAAFLASRRIRYRLIDFHRPSSTDGKLHPALYEWVKEYFRKPSDYKFPLYFQHQGHSRTIVGFEEGKKSKARLLILDPSMSRDHVEFLMKNIDPSSQPWDSYPAFVKKIWVPMTQLKAKQYQIVCVDGGFVDGSLEYTESKVLRSTRIP